MGTVLALIRSPMHMWDKLSRKRLEMAVMILWKALSAAVVMTSCELGTAYGLVFDRLWCFEKINFRFSVTSYLVFCYLLAALLPWCEPLGNVRE